MDHEYFKGDWRRKLSSIRKEVQRNKCAGFFSFVCLFVLLFLNNQDKSLFALSNI